MLYGLVFVFNLPDGQLRRCIRSLCRYFFHRYLMATSWWNTNNCSSKVQSQITTWVVVVVPLRSLDQELKTKWDPIQKKVFIEYRLISSLNMPWYNLKWTPCISRELSSPLSYWRSSNLSMALFIVMTYETAIMTCHSR